MKSIFFFFVLVAAVPVLIFGRQYRRLQAKKKPKGPEPVLTDAWARLKSPNKGTDIEKDPISLIRCYNQSGCIMPELQLEKSFKVYLCARTAYGIRFYYLVTEGLLLHPNIHITHDIDEAEVIVYLPTSSPWHKSECGHEKYFSKLVVLDEGDGPQIFNPDNAPKQWNILYFKRSYVSRRNGVFHGYMNYLEDRTKVIMGIHFMLV